MSKLPHNLLHELLDNIYWKELGLDTGDWRFLYIDKKVAERIRLKVSNACDDNTSSL